MYSSKIFKGLLIPAATLVAEDKLKTTTQSTPNLCRPSELPIYTPEPKKTVVVKEPEDTAPGVLEGTVATARQHFTRVYDEVKAYERVGKEYFDQTKDNAEWLLNYLREEDNTTPKAGAIAIGGLTGLIFGLRGGFLKRTIYATTGALGMAAICYPKEASEYSQIGIAEAKKYATIAYNFAYGVKKDDPPLELPSLPKIPSSFSEAWDSVTKSGSSLVSGAEAENQVMAVDGQLEEDLSDISQVDALTIVSKAHESSSQSCICPVGPCLGPHDESLAASNVPSEPSTQETTPSCSDCTE